MNIYGVPDEVSGYAPKEDTRETVTTENEIDWWTGEPEPETEPDLSMLTVRLPELD